jgi:LacI family transcriptional regulator
MAGPTLYTRAPGPKEVAAWFRRHQPEGVIGHFPEAIRWTHAAGAQLPESHGFGCLKLRRTDHDCASPDRPAAQISARDTELVVGQPLHHEMGVPTKPSLTTLTAQLIEGPTLRPRTKDAVEPPSWGRRANRSLVASPPRAP